MRLVRNQNTGIGFARIRDRRYSKSRRNGIEQSSASVSLSTKLRIVYSRNGLKRDQRITTPGELALLSRFLGISDPASYADMHGLQHWIAFVYFGLQQTYSRFPYFGYATDWLAFRHFAIAGFFILPFFDPVRYRAVLYIGLAACAGVIIVALICGPIRSIPWFWTMIDCSFGILGAIPLVYCLYLTSRVG